jgi:hypothetical protein
MNKLMGFLELNEMSIPSIPWKEYTGKETFNDDFLWTVRSAVLRGKDLNLPRIVGVDAKRARGFADSLLMQLGDRGMVVYYPYFIAQKSGTLCVDEGEIVIEAVRGDLWNMVTHSEREVTVIISNNGYMNFFGNKHFLNRDEIDEVKKYVPEIRKIFRHAFLDGKKALFEWSYAFSCDLNKRPINGKYLVFYEARTI